MTQERFEPSLKFVLKWEGSAFTNHPADAGGPTRFGVIQKVYDNFRKASGKPTQSVKFIAMDEVRAIYRQQYWNRVSGDQLPKPLDIALFDTGVLMGVGRAAQFLQASLGHTVDGKITSKTLTAANAADPVALTKKSWIGARRA